MSRIIQVNDSDYKVKVRYDGLDESSGTITLDVGIGGTVFVKGNLTVEGQTTTVNTTNTAIEDNRIVLNTGQTGNDGITPDDKTSGVDIYRGPGKDAASVLFDEKVSWYDNQTNTDKTGAFIFKVGSLLTGIRTNSITTDNKDRNLNLLGSSPRPGEVGVGRAVVSIHGVPDYADRINRKLDIELNRAAYDEAIPNVAWVNDALLGFFETTPPVFLKKSDSILEIFDAGEGDLETKLQLILDGVVNTQFKTTSTTFDALSLRLSLGTIQTLDLGLDLVLNPAGSGAVTVGTELNPSSLRIVLTSADPVQAASSVQVYTKTETYGGTGIYFVNNQSTRDELVSRRKALAYSMIF